MKLTETRIKQIILEEMENMKQKDSQDKEDETKTLQALKKFMLEKAKQVGNLRGASPKEVEQIAQFIDLMLSIIPKGEVAKYFEYAQQKLKDKAGIK